MILTVIIPFHHEEKSMAHMLRGLQECLTIPHEILLIHDDKNDPALSIIQDIQREDPSIQLLLNSHSQGVSGAIRTGLERSSGKYILFFVADDQGPISIIDPMLGLMDQGYDLVSGTRYARGGENSGGNFFARCISRWGNRLFCWLSSSQLSDPTCGIKMFRKDILQKAKIKPDSGWAMAFELAILSQHYDFKVTEIPFHSYNRIDGGESHFRIWPRVINYGRIFLWGILKLRKK